MSALAVRSDRQTTGTRARVLIADDHPLILAGIRRTLERSPDLEIVGEATAASHVLALIERRSPEVILLDLHMPGVIGAELVQSIHAAHPDVKIIVLSASDDPSAVEGALSAGARAYILKSINPVDLPEVIRRVAQGTAVPAPGRPATGWHPADELTDRERTILGAICSGQTTPEISRELWVSEHTIKFHLSNIYRKLGVSNRAGAIRFAMDNGLAA